MLTGHVCLHVHQCKFCSSFALQILCLILEHNPHLHLQVRDLDPENDLTFLRIRTKKHEVMIAPDKDFMLVVVQNPNSEDQVEL